MTAHTPGPWTVGEYTPTANFITITNLSCVCDAETRALIAVCGRADDRQSQVDADLIAAAPDLLAACERILAEFRLTADRGFARIYEGDDSLTALAGILEAAVAKARGAMTTTEAEATK